MDHMLLVSWFGFEEPLPLPPLLLILSLLFVCCYSVFLQLLSSVLQSGEGRGGEGRGGEGRGGEGAGQGWGSADSKMYGI